MSIKAFPAMTHVASHAVQVIISQVSAVFIIQSNAFDREYIYICTRGSTVRIRNSSEGLVSWCAKSLSARGCTVYVVTEAAVGEFR